MLSNQATAGPLKEADLLSDGLAHYENDLRVSRNPSEISAAMNTPGKQNSQLTNNNDTYVNQSKDCSTPNNN